MKDTNIFLIRQFVDSEISEDTKRVKTKKIVGVFQERIKKLNDEEFIEVMISCFIPDTYKNNGKRYIIY